MPDSRDSGCQLRNPRGLPLDLRLPWPRNKPYPCGYWGDRTRECHCTTAMIQRYVSKISGPLLDRIDIHIDVPAVNYKELRGGDGNAESSTQIRDRVIRARQIQLNRFAAAGEKIY